MKPAASRRAVLRAGLASLVAGAADGAGATDATGAADRANATGEAGAPARAATAPASATGPGVIDHPQAAWYQEARRMRELAESWGDQSYGAVVVAGGRVIGHGPSRVVKDGDPDAHAERVALREALAAQGGGRLVGAVLYSTSRPCAACEQAAVRAGVLRMFHGEGLHDAGPPRLR